MVRIVGELGKMAGRDHGLGSNQGRRTDLLEGVEIPIECELTQRANQTRTGSSVENEHRPRELGTPFEVQKSERRADVPMGDALVVLPPPHFSLHPHDDVVVFARAHRRIVRRLVRHAEQQITQGTCHLVSLCGQVALRIAEKSALGGKGLSLFGCARAPQLADLTREVLDSGAHLVETFAQLASTFVQFDHGGEIVDGGALASQTGLNGPKFGTQSSHIEHATNGSRAKASDPASGPHVSTHTRPALREGVMNPCIVHACMPAIAVEDLSVHHHTRRGGEILRAVDGVSFDVEPGEVLVLLGPNGAGKTSTVETLEGYRKPTAGRVRVLGLDPIADHGSLMAHVGVMLQQGGIHPGMRVVEAFRLYAAFYPDPIDPVVLLERTGLAHRARSTWRQLSGGEQQRLSLGLALVGRPTVVFLDEPTSGLDVSGRQVVREVVANLRDSGVAVLLTTHELPEAERLADRVVLIDHGRVVAAGTLSELTRSVEGRGVAFGAPPNLDVVALSARVGVQVIQVGPGEYRLDGDPTPVLLAELTAWLAEHNLALTELRSGRASLEDVFLRLTERSEQTDPEESRP